MTHGRKSLVPPPLADLRLPLADGAAKQEALVVTGIISQSGQHVQRFLQGLDVDVLKPDPPPSPEILPSGLDAPQELRTSLRLGMDCGRTLI